MNLTTRERLIQASMRLFADGGYRGASVRDICNHAGANPGAISYHFGGKRQLYRAVLRRAAANLSEVTLDNHPDDPEIDPPPIDQALRRIFETASNHQTSIRLLLHDLADGGAVAVESLTPPLRNALRQLTMSLGHGDNPRISAEAKRLLLALAAPLFLMTAGWTVLAQALELDDADRRTVFDEMVGLALEPRSGDSATAPLQ